MLLSYKNSDVHCRLFEEPEIDGIESGLESANDLEGSGVPHFMYIL